MILGIGLSKTGTKSLKEALQILGYKSLHLPSKQQLFSGNYEAFTDIPAYVYLTQLLTFYSKTRLICTTRNVDTWIESCREHFKPTNNAYFIELRNSVYGQSVFDEIVWRSAYKSHSLRLKVIAHYCNILFLPLESPNKWDLLCDFLNKSKPNVDYPKL
ncbi:sulfotransferase [Cyanobacterium aponinum UTEX 3221]|uniref:sulfotransferase n=1 Tax=Cyanobacterium aponinum TaxID=379064 RepID=UPI002B4BEA4D|nr:sulfotransferase [Cyanobacterium aponinum]WRL37052.1 sulfotransferase [Cyanobacterium aponinum UTEX 3221]